MDGEALRSYCASLPGATAGYPFGPGARVYKVGGRMFALVPDGPPLTVNLKCDPALAEILRDSHPGLVRPGYHMNKRHWNTVVVDGGLSDGQVRELIDHSYELVVTSLTRAQRAGLRA